MTENQRAISRRKFLESAGIAGAIGLGGLNGRQSESEPQARGGRRWRLPLRITERAGVKWQGERITVGVSLPTHCAAAALRLKNEETGELIPFGAGYGA